MSWERAWPLARDMATFATGLGMIIFQQVTGNVNLDLLLVATGLCGVPGIIASTNLLRGNAATQRIPEQSSLPPASPSQEVSQL